MHKMESASSHVSKPVLSDHLGLVRMVVRQYGDPSSPEAEDYFQEGVLGLSHALRKFDASRGLQFSTYAVWWIRKYVGKAASKQLKYSSSPSLQDPVGEDGESQRGDLLSDPLAEDPSEQTDRRLLAERIRELVRRLPERQRRAVELRFGLRGGTPLTYQETGAAMGVSCERARVLCARALASIRPAV